MGTIYSFGTWVRRRRKALDMTQRQLAELVGCALVTLKKIEADDRRPSAEMAERLAGALDIPAAERDAFLSAARGQRPADTLPAPADSAPAPLFRPRDVIPAAASPLVGREAEIATILALLDRLGTRLVTLAGPGGSGKTRLALAVAAALDRLSPRPFRDGIVFIDLSAAATAEQLTQAVSAAIGFEPDARRGPPRPQLIEYLRPRRCLLLLDNLEQIEGAAAVLGEVLQGTTDVKIVATSRRRLDLTWEHVLSLPGLPYPADAADPLLFPAGQLFMIHAERTRPGFTLREKDGPALARLCALVDGMPLALLLAAAWVDTLSVADIAAELQRDLGLPASEVVDLPERQRSLRVVWDSTWQRLDEAEQTAFARLCVFRGGFTRAAAESVAGVTLGGLGRLAGRFLISPDRTSGRYRIHELLRQYGYARLDAAEDDARRRHFDYFARFAEEQSARLRGPHQADALRLLTAEADNLTTALEYALARPTLDEFLRLIDAIHWYWRMDSHVAEASTWMERAIAQEGRAPSDEARLLYHAGHFAWMRGEFELARRRHAAALALYRDDGRGDTLDAAIAAEHLGMTMGQLNDAAAAAALFDEAQARFRALDTTPWAKWWLAFDLSKSAMAHHALGDRAIADAAATEHLRLVNELGDRWLLGLGRLHLADMAWLDGDYSRARQLAEEGLAAQRATGHVHSAGQTLLLLGEIARREGDETAARARFAEALALYNELGHPVYAAEARALLTEGQP